MNIYKTIKNKKNDGSYNIKIAISHNGATRYVSTDYNIESAKQFSKGNIVKRPDANYLNVSLNKMMNKFVERANMLEDKDFLSCNELVSIITKPLRCEQNRYFLDIVKEYTELICGESKSSAELYERNSRLFIEFIGKDIKISNVTSAMINSYKKELEKRKRASTTINIHLTHIRIIINYAIKSGYVKYDVNPFAAVTTPRAARRKADISVDEIKRIRDLTNLLPAVEVCRDLFMLSYYLCGMNMVVHHELVLSLHLAPYVYEASLLLVENKKLGSLFTIGLPCNYIGYSLIVGVGKIELYIC